MELTGTGPAVSPARLQRWRNADYTYAEVGGTKQTMMPAGYRHLEQSLVLGSGQAVFDRARTALFGWQVARRAGLTLQASSATAQQNALVILGFGIGAVRWQVACRVVYLVDEPSANLGVGPGGSRRAGWAYGTLPGHPEAGEEAFLLDLLADGSVIFTIRAFSRPDLLLTRVGAVPNRLVQREMTRRYLRTLLT